MVGNRLGVIAARIGDHTTGAGRFVQVADGVEGTANLERSDRLQVLRLDPERTVRIGPSRRNQLGPNDRIPYPVGGCLNVLDSDQLHGSSVPNGACRLPANRADPEQPTDHPLGHRLVVRGAGKVNGQPFHRGGDRRP
jgi:hypothetical protein